MTPKESCEIEISRFFKKYYTFTSSYDPDDLNNLLNSLCSSIEKYEIATSDNVSKNNKRYLALKALRNFSLHHSELLNSSKGIKPTDIGNIRAEVNILCLLPVSVVERIINDTRQEQTKKYIREVFIFYENYVDIYPSIFNFAVDIYFLVKKSGMIITGDGYIKMTESINYEINNNYNHYISGKIITLTGIPASKYIDEHIIEMKIKLEEEKGLPPGTTRYAKLLLTPSEQLKTLSKKEIKFIYDDLVSSNAIEIHNSNGKKTLIIRRPLTPIEHLIASNYKERR